MNKHDFLSALERALSALPERERREQLEYYSELIDDMVEDGMDEHDATERLGDVYTIAADILRENGAAEPSGSGERARSRVLIIIAACLAVIGIVCIIIASSGRTADVPAASPPVVTAAEGQDSFLSGLEGLMDGIADLTEGITGEVMDGIVSAFSDFGRDWDNEYSPSGEYSVGAEAGESSITSLEIDWTAGSVTVSPHDGDGIVFRESSEDPIPSSDALRWGVEGGTLYIQYSRSGAHDLPAKDLTVLLPGELASGLTELNVSSVSAPLRLSGLETASADLASVSGGVYYSGAAEELSVSTVSGGVELRPERTPDRLTADTVSGGVTIALSETDWTLDFSTVSGHFSSDFYPDMGDGLSHVSLGDGPRVIYVSTTSGSLNLLRQ